MRNEYKPLTRKDIGFMSEYEFNAIRSAVMWLYNQGDIGGTINFKKIEEAFPVFFEEEG